MLIFIIYYFFHNFKLATRNLNPNFNIVFCVNIYLGKTTILRGTALIFIIRQLRRLWQNEHDISRPFCKLYYYASRSDK